MDLNEERILERLRLGEEEAFVEIYSKYKTSFVLWLKEKFGIEKSEGIEIFQLTVVTFFENLKNNKITELKSSLKTYLFAIGKNKAHEALRSNQKTERLEFTLNGYEEGLAYIIEDENIEDQHNREETMKLSMDKLGNPCSQILTLFYFNHLSLEEIKNRFGYKNEGSIKSQKFKCMERLRKIYFQHHRRVL